MISVTRMFEFAYAHKLEGHDGHCQNLHGHNGVLEVEVAPCTLGFGNSYCCQLKEGHQVPLRDAMVTDFSHLKQVVTETVVDYLDHKYLNDLFTFHPTAENLCMWIVDTLKANLIGLRIMRVRLWENSRSYAEWKRGD